VKAFVFLSLFGQGSAKVLVILAAVTFIGNFGYEYQW